MKERLVAAAALACASAWSATAFQFPGASTGLASTLLHQQRSQFRSWDDEREDRRRDREEDVYRERGGRGGERGPPRRDFGRDDRRSGRGRGGVQRTPLSELRQRPVPAPLLGAVMTTYESQSTSEEDKEHFFSIKSLADIGASNLAVEALAALGITRPSKIQAASYQSVLEGHHCVIAEQTGSGKTLAYLLPLVQRLRQEEDEATAPAAGAAAALSSSSDAGEAQPVAPKKLRGDKRGKGKGRAQPGRPRVVVLSPTGELAQQVHAVARRLSGVTPFRTCCFTGGNSRSLKSQANMLSEGIDVLIATPGRVSTLLEDGALSLEDCRAVVLDEVDVLFTDETFRLAPIGAQAPDGAQFLFVTATLPQEVGDMVKQEFPGTKFITGPGLHRVAPGVEEVLIDCSGPPDEAKNEATGQARKREALMAQLDRRAGVLRTLVFCNTIRSCREVENALRRIDRRGARYSTLAYHSAIESATAAANLREFARSNALRPMVLVCTDRSSRGMDFDSAAVEHVVLYDFPRDPIEYMRRVGRTARAGRKGIVTVLAWGRQVPLAREIMAGNKLGKKLLTLEE